MDPAVRILAKAMFDVVEEDGDRKDELGKTLDGDFNEFDLRPHFNELSANEKAACSDRVENLAEEHVQTGPAPAADAGSAVFYAPKGTGRSL
jgi:hypothetical protein